jgi:hypothetical protein
MNREEYERYSKELEDAEREDGESSPPKQVFTTLSGADDEDEDPEKTPPRAKIPDPPQPEAPPRVCSRQTTEPSQGWSLKFYEGMQSYELMERVGEEGEHVQHPKILSIPITLDVVADPEALEATRKELVERSKKIVNVTTSVLQDKVDTERLIERAKTNERKVKKALLSAKKLVEAWQAKVNETHEEAQRMRREAISPRNINFDSAARPEPLATPKDNMKMAAELLAKSNEDIDIEHLRTVISTAMKQQSKADTSRKLESNPEGCVSTA